MQKNIFKLKYLSNVTVTRKSSSWRIGIVGVPFSKGQPKSGTEKGPEIMRNAGIIEDIRSLGYNVKDYGDIEINNKDARSEGLIKNLPQVAACAKNLSKVVGQIISENRIAFTIGGDHSIAVGSVDGHIEARGGGERVSVLWVDAHADINTSTSSPSGNAHGMPLSLLVKELEGERPNDAEELRWQRPRLPIRNLAFIGLRDLDQYEREILKRYNVKAFDMGDIDEYGIGKVTGMALDGINPDGKNSLHVSFDVDSLDVREAPCTGTPVRGGLTLREAMRIMEVVRKTAGEQLSAVDLVEINPLLGNEHELRLTVQSALYVVRSIFGRCRYDSVPNFKT